MLNKCSLNGAAAERAPHVIVFRLQISWQREQWLPDGETEKQRGEGTCTRTESKSETEARQPSPSSIWRDTAYSLVLKSHDLQHPRSLGLHILGVTKSTLPLRWKKHSSRAGSRTYCLFRPNIRKPACKQMLPFHPPRDGTAAQRCLQKTTRLWGPRSFVIESSPTLTCSLRGAKLSLLLQEMMANCVTTHGPTGSQRKILSYKSPFTPDCGPTAPLSLILKYGVADHPRSRQEVSGTAGGWGVRAPTDGRMGTVAHPALDWSPGVLGCPVRLVRGVAESCNIKTVTQR